MYIELIIKRISNYFIIPSQSQSNLPTMVLHKHTNYGPRSILLTKSGVSHLLKRPLRVGEKIGTRVLYK